MRSLCFLLVFLHKPIFHSRRLGPRRRSVILALHLDRHALVLLQARGQVRLLGRLGWLRFRERLHMLRRVRFLDRYRLVCLELLQVQLLDKVRCGRSC
jgi:hypothetical protein